MALLTEAQINGQFTSESNLYPDSQPSSFPLVPILDNIIIREIPLSEFLTRIGGVEIPLDDERWKRTSDRGEVVAVSPGVSAMIAPGAIVIVNEYGKRPIYLNPADEFDSGKPKYFKLRLADVEAVVR